MDRGARKHHARANKMASAKVTCCRMMSRTEEALAARAQVVRLDLGPTSQVHFASPFASVWGHIMLECIEVCCKFGYTLTFTISFLPRQLRKG